jgi:predicted transcriptional regulator
MNSYRLNGMAGHVTRRAICKSLGIKPSDIYKEVKDMHVDGTVVTKDGKKYQVELREIVDENK